jgi:hypothetical protein
MATTPQNQSGNTLSAADVKELTRAMARLSTIMTGQIKPLAKALDLLSGLTTDSVGVGRQTLKSDRDTRKVDQKLIDSLVNLTESNEQDKRKLAEAVALAQQTLQHAAANTRTAAERALKTAEADYLKFHDQMKQVMDPIIQYTDDSSEQFAKQLELEKQSVELKIKESTSRKERISAEKQLSTIQAQIAEKNESDATTRLTAAKAAYAAHGSLANQTAQKRAQLELDTAKANSARAAKLAAPNGALVPVFETLAKRVKEFVAGLSLASAATSVYGDMITQRSTGGANSIIGGNDNNSSILGNYGTAAAQGINTKTLMEIRQSTRAAELSAGSQAKFDQALFGNLAGLYDITESRNEAAQIGAGILSATQEVGISAPAGGKLLGDLTEQFGKLSRLTGLSTVSIAKMTEGITKDSDQREIMLGMGEKQKSMYLLEQVQRMAQYKQAGYSIEQAQELIRLQAQQHNKKALSKFTDYYTQQLHVSQIEKGLRDTGNGDRAAKVAAAQQRDRELEMRGRNVQASSPEGQQIIKERAELKGIIGEQAKFLINSQTTAGDTGKNVAVLQQWQESLDKLKGTDAAYGIVNQGAKDVDQTAAKAGSPSGSAVTNGVTTLVDRVSSILTNPILQGAGGLAYFTSTMFFHGVAIKYMMMKMKTSVGSLAKGAWDGVKGAGGKVAGATKTGLNVAKTGGGYLINAAKTGGSFLASNAGKIASIGSKLSLGGIAAYVGGDYLADQATSQAAKGNVKTGATLDTAGYALQGGALGATIGSVLPIAGTAAGAAIGAGLGGAYGLYQNWGKIAQPTQSVVSSALSDKKAEVNSLTGQKTFRTTPDGSSTGTKTPEEISKEQSIAATEHLTARVVQLLEILVNKPESENQTKLTNEYMRNGSNLRIATAMYSQPVINVPS